MKPAPDHETFCKLNTYLILTRFGFPPCQPHIFKIFGLTIQYIILAPKIKVRFNGVLPVQAHAQSCVHNGTNMNIYFKNILVWSSMFARANM